MRKIHSIKKYEVVHGTTYNYNPWIIVKILQDCEQEECMTYGDPDMEEDGLYEFDREGFKEAVNWAASQDEQYFEQFKGYMLQNGDSCKSQALDILKGILQAGAPDDIVRLEIY